MWQSLLFGTFWKKKKFVFKFFGPRLVESLDAEPAVTKGWLYVETKQFISKLHTGQKKSRWKLELNTMKIW